MPTLSDRDQRKLELIRNWIGRSLEADFTKSGATLVLAPAEFSFLVRCLNDRLSTLDEEEISVRLGIDADDAKALLRGIVALESAARAEGRHWLPPKVGPGSSGDGAPEGFDSSPS